MLPRPLSSWRLRPYGLGCTVFMDGGRTLLDSEARACVFSSASHLHFWQNDRDLLRATAVTRGWNGYRYASQHRKLTMWNKIIPPGSRVLSVASSALYH